MAGNVDIFQKLYDLQQKDLIKELCEDLMKKKTSVISSKEICSTSGSQLEDIQDELDLSDFLTEHLSSNSKKNKRVTKGAIKSVKKITKKTKSPTKEVKITKKKESRVVEEDREGPPSSRTRRSLRLLQSSFEKEEESVSPGRSRTQNARGEGQGQIPGRGRGRGRGRGSQKSGGQRRKKQNLNEIIDLADPPTNDTEIVDNDFETFCDTRQANVPERLRVMRGRRRYLAEKAARCVQVDHIDLIESPMVSVTGFIDLSDDNSDNESKSPIPSILDSKSDQLPLGEELISEDNCEMNIRIRWMNKVEQFKLRKYQKFKDIFELLAQREQVDPERIFLNLNDRIITPTDTPDSLAYKCFDCIHGRVMNAEYIKKSFNGHIKKDNVLQLKVQANSWKRPLTFDILKTDTFRVLYIKCAEEVKLPINKLKLSINGEVLEHTATPIDMDIEDDEIIDLFMKN